MNEVRERARTESAEGTDAEKVGMGCRLCDLGQDVSGIGLEYKFC